MRKDCAGMIWVGKKHKTNLNVFLPNLIVCHLDDMRSVIPTEAGS